MKKKTTTHQYGNSKGTSLIEVILAMVISLIIILVIVQTLIAHLDAFYYVANRRSSVADARYALIVISNNLKNISPGTITDIQSSQFTYTESMGPTTFRFYTADSISRNNDVLLKDVNNFWFNYFDQNGAPLSPTVANIPNVRRIRVSIETKPHNDEGSITISAFVVPRDF